jgi:hypothetical protein
VETVNAMFKAFRLYRCSIAAHILIQSLLNETNRKCGTSLRRREDVIENAKS